MLHQRTEVYTKFWWGNLKSNRQLCRPIHRWEDNIKIDVEEIW